jgi:SSS family solute:Na+ symporter
MSTLSSLVLTSSSTLTLDVIAPASKKGMSEKKKLITLRLFIVFFIVVSAGIAIVKDMFPGFTFIAQMMGVSWGALAGAFLAPFLYGLYSKKTTKAAVFVSFVFGVGLEVVQLLCDFGVLTIDGGFLGFVFTNSLYSGVFAMVGGLILVPIVSLITPKMEKSVTDGIFSCYEKEVKVYTKESLGK